LEPAVPRAQDTGKGLTACGLEAEERMKAEAALVGTGRSFLLRVGRHQGGVDIQDHAPGRIGERPYPPAGDGPGPAHLRELLLGKGGHQAEGGGVRGHRSEEHLLVAQGAEVTEGIAAIGQHDPEIAQNVPGLVPTTALRQVGQGPREGAGETHPIGKTHQQGRARPGGERATIGPDFHRGELRSILHLRGDLLVLGLQASSPCIIPAQEVTVMYSGALG